MQRAEAGTAEIAGKADAEGRSRNYGNFRES